MAVPLDGLRDDEPNAHWACLTFDFDAFAPKLFGGASGPVPMSQGEFSAVGAARILDLLALRKIACTWFIPGHTLETYPDLARRIHAAGHEIGHHGYLHEMPPTLSRTQEEEVMVRGIECIRRVTGAPPRGYRTPGWDMSAHTIELLVAHGFDYDASLMGADHLPYLVRQGDEYSKDGPVKFGQPTSLVEMPGHWSLDDFPHFEFILREGFAMQGLMRTDHVLANWLDEFRYARSASNRAIVTYTMHPEVIGRGHRMLMLERLIDGLAALGARFGRLDAAADLGRRWLSSVPAER